MFERGRLVSSLLCTAAMVAGSAILIPFYSFADSVPIPTHVDLSPGPLPTLFDNGVPGVFVLTVKNPFDSTIMITSKCNTIPNPCVTFGPFVEVGFPDAKDRVVAMPLKSTTCFKPTGQAIPLAPGMPCTFTFDPTPSKGPDPDDLTPGATTATFSISANRGKPGTMSPTFTVLDVPAGVPEPATLSLFATGALGLAALVRHGLLESNSLLRHLTSAKTGEGS